MPRHRRRRTPGGPKPGPGPGLGPGRFAGLGTWLEVLDPRAVGLKAWAHRLMAPLASRLEPKSPWAMKAAMGPWLAWRVGPMDPFYGGVWPYYSQLFPGASMAHASKLWAEGPRALACKPWAHVPGLWPGVKAMVCSAIVAVSCGVVLLQHHPLQ